MRKILTEIKKYSIIVIIITAVLGVLLIAIPDKMLAYTALFIGGAFTACGVFALISYISSDYYLYCLPTYYGDYCFLYRYIPACRRYN